MFVQSERQWHSRQTRNNKKIKKEERHAHIGMNFFSLNNSNYYQSRAQQKRNIKITSTDRDSESVCERETA